ncbi:hypothetical protein ABZZ79_28560 [Streptomyces sp. NPDC006458]|uniref:hypothetical protein n=1 Tax=Streptomyces sp. NPDC006458 TaxID=3154302 RepID=UPI0033B8FF98
MSTLPDTPSDPASGPGGAPPASQAPGTSGAACPPGADGTPAANGTPQGPSSGDDGSTAAQPGPDGTPASTDLHRSVRSFALMGGLGGAAAVLTAVSVLIGGSPADWFQDDNSPGGPTASPPSGPTASGPGTAPPDAPASSVTIQQPTTRDGEQVEVEQCQEFRGTARLAPGYTLWLAGRTETDRRYGLYVEASVSPGTGRWRATAQLGGPTEGGRTFEVVAVPVPSDVSEYLRDITDSQNRRLLQKKDGTGSAVGLFNPALPPRSDDRHMDSVTVRRTQGDPNC